MNIFFKLSGIDKLIEKLNSDIKRFGWYNANVKFINSLGIKAENDLENFPEKGPAVLISRHLTGLDPYIISSVIPRDDLYFLSDIYQTKKGEMASKHMIPISYWDKLAFLKRTPVSWLGYFMMRSQTGYVTKDKAQKDNFEAVVKATETVKNKNVLLIFPSGGDDEKRPWKPGLGKILSLLVKQNIKVPVYGVNIEGLVETSIIKHFLGRMFFKSDVKPIKVKIKELDLNYPSFKNKSAYEMSQKMKELYETDFKR